MPESTYAGCFCTWIAVMREMKENSINELWLPIKLPQWFHRSSLVTRLAITSRGSFRTRGQCTDCVPQETEPSNQIRPLSVWWKDTTRRHRNLSIRKGSQWTNDGACPSKANRTKLTTKADKYKLWTNGWTYSVNFFNFSLPQSGPTSDFNLSMSGSWALYNHSSLITRPRTAWFVLISLVTHKTSGRASSNSVWPDEHEWNEPIAP